MKIKHRNIIFLGILPVIIIVCIYLLLLKVTTKTVYGSYTSMDAPEWILEEIDISSTVVEEQPGPALEAGDETYGVLRVMFYDASTNKRITDLEFIEELLSMFQYSDEPYIYSRERTRGGVCFFYYNGVIPAKYPANLFAGFTGNVEVLQNRDPKIERFYMRFHGSTIPASFTNDLEKALNEFKT